VSETEAAIGRLVGDARERSELSQQDAARALGVHQSRLAKIESGARRLLFSEALDLARLFCCTTADFDPSLRESIPRRGVRRRRIPVHR
jgi:transcriptional regulator with XRE-family HTH domain